MTSRTTAQDAAFVEDFRTMSAFGATANGGVDRQAATAPDGEQRRWLTGLLQERGFTVKFDHAGNQWGLYEAVPGAPFVVVGSHMDSQPTAGRYDGAYGVLAAAHAAFRLVAQWNTPGAPAPRFNIAVVNWFNEEG
ncbi:MAG: Zn-dependent hydrolase, partial [Gemmatimonadales bacterium]